MTSPVTSIPPPGRQRGSEALGIPFILLVVYLIMEYARPANPMKLPMIISIVLALTWLLVREKHWPPQIICFMLLLAVIASMGPFAVNSFAIWMGFRQMTIEILCICLPLVHFVSSVRKVSLFVNAIITVYAYVAIYGLLHGGRGPGGHIGDENDLALALNLAIPFAFFSILVARGARERIVRGVAVGLMVAGVVATFSRGGFVGLVPVLAYCVFFAPKKKAAIIVGLFLFMGLWLYTPQSYWKEIASIEETVDSVNEEQRDNRLEFWEIAVRMFKANPILGVGLSNFPYNAGEYQSEEQFRRLERSLAGQAVHSLYFAILSELGMAGMLLFLAVLFFNLKDINYILTVAKPRGRSGLNRNGQTDVGTGTDEALAEDLKRAKFYAHALRAAIIGFLVSGTFITVFNYPHFWILSALTAALRLAVTKRQQEVNRADGKGSAVPGRSMHLGIGGAKVKPAGWPSVTLER